MPTRLAKLAAISSKLRCAVKLAGLPGVLGSAALKLIKANPGTAGVAGLSTAIGGVSGVGAYRKHKAGFDPAVQKQTLGPTEE